MLLEACRKVLELDLFRCTVFIGAIIGLILCILTVKESKSVISGLLLWIGITAVISLISFIFFFLFLIGGVFLLFIIGIAIALML